MDPEKWIERQEQMDETDFHRGHVEANSGEFFRPDETLAWKRGWKAGKEPGMPIADLKADPTP